MQTPKFSKIHNRFRLNGYFYDRNTLKEVAYNFIKEGDHYESFMGDFILDWLDNSDSIYLSTSISKKSKILVKKQSLVSSAISTGDFLKVSVGDKALHCLPTNYIAGKMMLIRALILGLEIDFISPSKKPFYKNYTADQIFLSMQESPQLWYNVPIIYFLLIAMLININFKNNSQLFRETGIFNILSIYLIFNLIKIVLGYNKYGLVAIRDATFILDSFFLIAFIPFVLGREYASNEVFLITPFLVHIIMKLFFT